MNKMHTTLHASLFVFGFSAFLPHGLSVLIWVLSTEQRRLHLEQLPPKSIMVLLATFAFWPFVVTAYSGWYTDTNTRLFHMVRVALMLQMGLMATSTERLIAFKGLIWGAIFASLVVICHRFFPLPEWAIWHHLLEVKGSQSSRAMIMLALTSGICIAMWFKAKNSLQVQPLLWIGGGLLFAIVVGLFSISRNAQIVLLAMPLVLLVHHYRSWKGLLAAIMVCVFLAWLSWEIFPSTSARFAQAIAELRNVINSGNCSSSVGVRFAMYEMAWRELLAHPLMGTGIGSFVDHWAELAQSRCPTTAGIRQPHNDFLLFAMESGWIGLASTLALIYWFVKAFWKQSTIEGTTGLLLCVTFCITGMVNSPMRDAGIGFVMIFLLAACYLKNEQTIK
jgi:O-antigen ligase